MKKRFNTAGVCIPHLHFMVDINKKIKAISELINYGDYFVINRPRQYGKTTTMYMLEGYLQHEYVVMSISFEGLGDDIFKNESQFTAKFLDILSKSIRHNNKEMSNFVIELNKNIETFSDLSDAITEIIEKAHKPVILLIDEVDKSSNNQLFLSFLGMLRNKFLSRQQGKDKTFHSVILAGVYDVKNLKIKLRADEEKKYNSPWNIAVNFNIDMSFQKEEIKTMIEEYCTSNNIELKTEDIAERLYFYTSGYPFLVSSLCKILDEILQCHSSWSWNEENINKAVKILLQENNTLFDDLIKNLENNKELHELARSIVIDGRIITYNQANPLINLGTILGIFKAEENITKVHNRIFEHYIYDYLVSKLEVESKDLSHYNFKESFLINNGLDFEKVLVRFQQFMKEQYSSIDSQFIEREGRLLFLAFIKPIINGVGFDFKEVQISEEKRLDIVITYLTNKYLIELKIWRGEEYHKKGLKQLYDYLNIQDLNTGYLVIYNFNKNKEYKKEKISYEGKEIFIVWV